MTVKTDTKADRMMALFEGFSEAYGTYDSSVPNEEKGGKLEIRRSARTVREPVTIDLWRKHLSGEASLGIIPIRDNNTCLWGVIDIDVYGVVHSDLIEAAKRDGLPLVVCRSKSGGAHLFLFLAEPVEAEIVQSRLKEMAALLGFGSAEVFPKQRQVHVDRGDLGSWLNMPYFAGDETERYAVKPGGMAATVGEFLAMAESLKQPAVFLQKQDFKSKKGAKKNPDFGDGPPCMQHLSETGFPEGTRNKGLFALATFAKKKYGTGWVDVVERWNRELMDPPLPSSEVMDVIRGQEKKEYFYTCREQPLSSHCNSSLCRARKYGVGGDDDYPVLSGLSVLETDPPLWFLDVENERLELTTDELQNYKSFHKVCMERLFICYRMMKQDAWLQIVASSMQDAVRIEAPKEVGRSGQFYELLEEYVTNRHRAESRDDILSGRPWEDVENSCYYFRLQDLQKFLEKAGFVIYNRGQMVSRLRALGGDSHFFNIKGRGVNVWWIPSVFQPMPSADTPPLERDPI